MQALYPSHSAGLFHPFLLSSLLKLQQSDEKSGAEDKMFADINNTATCRDERSQTIPLQKGIRHDMILTILGRQTGVEPQPQPNPN